MREISVRFYWPNSRTGENLSQLEFYKNFIPANVANLFWIRIEILEYNLSEKALIFLWSEFSQRNKFSSTRNWRPENFMTICPKISFSRNNLLSKITQKLFTSIRINLINRSEVIKIFVCQIENRLPPECVKIPN